MLYIVLALVLGAFGLLIAALTTANTLWAWISVVVSVVAAGLLITDWLSGRRAARAKASGKTTGKTGKPTVVTVGGHRRKQPSESSGLPTGNHNIDTTDDDWFAGAEGKERPAEPVEQVQPAGVADVVEPEPDTEVTGHIEPIRVDAAEAPVDPDREPDEEPTDASDLLVVAGLSAEVRVVDEHPRYHLATCTWLGPRPTIPIAVSEARQLGFTPCARCGPDSVLAARHRAAR